MTGPGKRHRVVLFQDNSAKGHQMRDALLRRGVNFEERIVPTTHGVPQVAFCGDCCHSVEETEKLINRLPQYP